MGRGPALVEWRGWHDRRLLFRRDPVARRGRAAAPFARALPLHHPIGILRKLDLPRRRVSARLPPARAPPPPRRGERAAARRSAGRGQADNGPIVSRARPYRRPLPFPATGEPADPEGEQSRWILLRLARPRIQRRVLA